MVTASENEDGSEQPERVNAEKPDAAGEQVEDITSSFEGSDPDDPGFSPLVLEKTVIALPLFDKFEEDAKKPGDTAPVYAVIIDVNLLYLEGREAAKKQVQKTISRLLKDDRWKKRSTRNQGVNTSKTAFSEQYVFAVLEENVIKELVRRDTVDDERQGKSKEPGLRSIYHIWPDFEIRRLTTKSVSTVKADAAMNAFSAMGEDIYWAVMDSGIDGNHPHFKSQENLVLPPMPAPLQHRDFTVLQNQLSAEEHSEAESKMMISPDEKPLEDIFGHGTHVAGIIAGELEKSDTQQISATTLQRDETNQLIKNNFDIQNRISGMAPRCKLVSLKVLDDSGAGQASNLIAAIQWIQEINGYGRRIKIHGVNMSVGYEFEPEWFACGQSPLCVEVDRLVKSGVVVVVAAGNTGYGFVQAQGKRTAVAAGIDLTINDPGNAELAITVGSTHREMPHVYGISYFSSKGPTGDGRLKPDLVAPGEKIISCDSAQRRASKGEDTATEVEMEVESKINGQTEKRIVKSAHYRESSGTSMAAPHVSGVIAAFLSVRREFIGKPEQVKEIFLSTATDLKREKYFQGHGLVDLMRAIQSI